MITSSLHRTRDPADPEGSRAALLEQADRALDQADLVVLPELPWCPFVLDSPEAAAEWAEPVDGPTVEALAALARGRGVLVSGLLLREGATLSNAQVVLDRDGSLAGIYRKHHLWGPDHCWATPGPTPGALVETAIGHVGLLICHDAVYPDTVRAVTAARPAALAFSTAWVGDGEPFPLSWLRAARELEGAPFVVANRGGREGPFHFADPSAILRWNTEAQRVEGSVGERTPAAYTLLS